MSYVARNAVRAMRCGSSGIKQLLDAMAEIARDEPQKSLRGKVWPALHVWCSVAHLVEATEQDRKTVLRNLKLAEDKGFIAQVGTDGGTNQIKVFKLVLSGAQEGASPEVATSPDVDTGSEGGTGAMPLTGPKFPLERSQLSLEAVPTLGHGLNVMNKKRTRKTSCKHDVESIGFAEFYAAYPRKVDRSGASKAFAALHVAREPALLGQMIAAIQSQGLAEKCARGDEQFVPHPARWLKNKRWLDAVPSGPALAGYIGSAEGRSSNGVSL